MQDINAEQADCTIFVIGAGNPVTEKISEVHFATAKQPVILINKMSAIYPDPSSLLILNQGCNLLVRRAIPNNY